MALEKCEYTSYHRSYYNLQPTKQILGQQDPKETTADLNLIFKTERKLPDFKIISLPQKHLPTNSHATRFYNLHRFHIHPL